MERGRRWGAGKLGFACLVICFFGFFFLSAKCRVKALLVERLLTQRLKGALLHLTCVHHVERPV